MASELSNLMQQVNDLDPAVGKELRRHIASLTQGRENGLIFERHLPEQVALVGRPISVGDKVRFIPKRGLDESESDDTWFVTDITGPKDERVAQLVERAKGTTCARAVGDLVYVADFRDPIYPGLESVGRVDRGGDDKPFHAVINAENYHALEALCFTHLGKIDAIYIDPPYGTGHKDWKYNDAWVDSNDGYRHSKWLSFMEKRLLLAKKLLKDSGFLLISIDDRQQHRLRMLLDQTFGEANFIANFVWRSDGNLDNQAQVKINHEYIVMYAKRHETVRISGVKDPNLSPDSKLHNAEIRNSVVKNGPKNPVSGIIIPAGFPANFDAGVISARTDKWPHYDSDIQVSDGRVAEPVTATSGWANANLLRKFIDNGFQTVVDSKGQDTVFELLPTGTIENVKGRRKDQHHILTVLSGLGTVETAGNELRKMGVEFPFPKPQPLLAYLLSFAPRDGVILDFFAGSGSTADAVMNLNESDGGSRQSISVTNNEVNAKDESKLRKASFRPGDPQWESRGVFRSATLPRLTTVASGVRMNGTPHPASVRENVEFFTLTYLNPQLVELDMAFSSVAPLLWIRAGAQGRRIDERTDTFDVADTYAVLFSLDASAAFIDAVEQADGLRVVYIVTDDEPQFQAVATQLPEGVEAVRLYESYLRTFQINTERD